MDLTAREGGDNFVPPLAMTMKDRHDEPATKGDLAELGRELDERFERFDQRLDRADKSLVQLRQDFKTFKDELEQKAEALHEETRRHFDVVAEKIHHDAIGARKDDIELLKGRRDDHERRIGRLEKSAGLIAA